MSKVIEVPASALQKGYGPCEVRMGHNVLLVVEGAGHHSYFFGAVLEGGSARQVTMGPLVAGPWAYAGKMDTVFTQHKRPEKVTITASLGDVLVIEGTGYRIVEAGWGDIALVNVEG